MKLKNLFGMAAMAALVLSGCSSDEVVNDYSPENAIEFGTYVGRDAQSRVAETTTETLKAKDWGFGVFANYSGEETGIEPNFMNNEDVHWTANAEDATKGEWTYSPVKYWPNTKGHKVSFWAYAPYSDYNKDQTVKMPFFRIEDGTDFVAVAEPVVSEKQGYNDKVEFEFVHMMSKIGFKVEAVIDEIDSNHSDKNQDGTDNGDEDPADNAKNEIAKGTQIVVTKVTMNGAFDQEGKMMWEQVENKYDWKLYTSDATKSKEYTLTSDNFNKVSEVPYAVTEEGTQKYKGQKVSIDKEILNNTESYWMVIPQTVNGMTITVEYNVITKDPNLATKYSDVKNTVTSEPFNFTFERGKAYDFVLHLGLTSVKFEATVNEWDGTVNDVIVNVPINVATTNSNSN